MNLAALSLPDLIGAILGFVFTLFIFSYLLGDNPLFRLAVHIFIGVAAGFTAVIAWNNVLWPQLLRPIMSGSQSERLFAILPLILGGLLLTKISPRIPSWGNPAMAFLVGVGIASAIGGAVLGTIFPQVAVTANLFDLPEMSQSGTSFWSQLLNGGIILLGTLTSLIYFHFGVKSRPDHSKSRLPVIENLARIGQIFIAITFGVLFAGVYAAALTAFVERLYFLVNFLLSFFGAK